VFTALTTNRLDILDPALIRSKRLKVMEVSGHLTKKDITDIIKQKLNGIPLIDNIDENIIYDFARGLCNTPADFSAFVEKARSVRNTEFEVLNRARTLVRDSDEERENFVKFNYKTLMGMLDAVSIPESVRKGFKGHINNFLDGFSEFVNLFEHVTDSNGYPLVQSHLLSARAEISQSPVKKGKVQLDEFLEGELSQEPQVGFIIGVGANDVTGVLLPIATSLTYSLSPEKVLVTGAVSSSTAVAAELDMAVQMTQQSAKEALTLVKNYFQSLDPKVSIPKLLGEFLEKYTIHHQLLSASYQVGGPSAGYALALNTLSTLLQMPICNDFGITGAPWTKGVKRGEVGGSVIIGGHKKKAEKVLLHLRRMYMPLQNYRDLEADFLAEYWSMNKDILGVSNFGDLAPELIWLGSEYDKTLQGLIDIRIQYKLKKHRGHTDINQLKAKILEKKTLLKKEFEKEIFSRLSAIRDYLRNPVSDPHLSLEEILKEHPKKQFSSFQPVITYFKEKFRRKNSKQTF
jgi:hypothetical protein